MIYTCFEMIRDCRENRPEGWRYFISNYVPVVKKLIRHYRPENANVLDGLLLELRSPQSKLFANSEPAPERPFVAELRQQVLETLDRIAPLVEPSIAIDPDTLMAAVEMFTLLEKQVVWLETMGYGSKEAGVLMHAGEATIEKIRERAAGQIRARADEWRATLLAENGRHLARSAAAGTPECLPAKAFLDVVDGRATWRGREDLERHVSGCWHCIDHFCRMREVVELLRGLQPLSDEAAEPFRQRLGIMAEKRPGWKRLFGAGSR